MIGGEIINTDLLSYVRIVEPGDPFIKEHPSVPANSVIYSVGPAITVKPIFNTYAEAKEWVDKLFKMLTAEKNETETSGKPEPVSFEKYQDQWVKAKLTYHESRLKTLKDGEVYRIMPYLSMCDRRRFQCKSEHFKGLRNYSWEDVQFELVEEGGEQ